MLTSNDHVPITLATSKARLGTVMLAALWLYLSPCFGEHAWGADQPNILLILCDDMGWSDIGCYGGEIKTPNLDRLAANGLRFTQFYNNAKCTTTRASLMTGLYPRRGQGSDDQLLGTNMLTLAEALRLAGYQTGLFGKWHLGRSDLNHPCARGFDEYYGLLGGACNYFDPSLVDPPYKGSQTRFFAQGNEQITDFPADFYTTDAFTDEALKALERYARDDKPFFLHVCYNAPHYPLHALPEDIDKYRGEYLQGWDELRRQRFERQKAMQLLPEGCRLSDRDSRAYEWETADHEFEDLRMAVYAAMIDRMDKNIGRLLELLDKTGAAENTLILFLSDNGGCAEEPGGRDPAVRKPGPRDDYVAVGPAWGWAQNAPFRRYKVWMHEGGICTPLIVHWPGVVESGTITGQVGHIIDVMPTVIETAGYTYPAEHNDEQLLPLEGRSLVPIFRGNHRPAPERLCWSYNGNAAIRRGDWKLVWDKLIGEWELYDLGRDRTELVNLAPQEPARVAAMANDYNAWARSTGNKEHRNPGSSSDG